eukprot:c12010_g2_i1.p1 GENE.c12010_g2_i1~~c12010_g2_i1.p1  ORF type:complete len:766 (-),score=161.96 c12010_g2_i1:75-2156(-)
MSKREAINSFRGFGGKYVMSLNQIHTEALAESNINGNHKGSSSGGLPNIHEVSIPPPSLPQALPGHPQSFKKKGQSMRKQSIQAFDGFGSATVQTLDGAAASAARDFQHLSSSTRNNNQQQDQAANAFDNNGGSKDSTANSKPHSLSPTQNAFPEDDGLGDVSSSGSHFGMWKRLNYLWELVDGTMPAYNEVFAKQHILIDMFFNALPRGVSQVFFINNPISGIIIFISLLLADPTCIASGLLGLFSSNLIAVLMGFPRPLMQAGLYGYNGFLCGIALRVFITWPVLPASHSPSTSDNNHMVQFIAFNMLVSAFSTVITIALGNAMIPVLKIPPLTFPFNISTAMALLVVRRFGRFPFIATFTPASADLMLRAVQSNTTCMSDGGVACSPASWDWCEHAIGPMQCDPFPSGLDFVYGSLRGMSQVYFIGNEWSGLGLFFGLFLSSRIAAFSALGGSVIGLICAIAIGVPPGQVTIGLWGYAPALSGVAICGMFFVPTIRAAAVAAFCCAITVLVHGSLTAIMNELGLPTLTFGFAVGTTFFTLLQRSASALVPVSLESITTPESHYRKYQQVLRQRKTNMLLSPRSAAAEGATGNTFANKRDSAATAVEPITNRTFSSPTTSGSTAPSKRQFGHNNNNNNNIVKQQQQQQQLLQQPNKQAQSSGSPFANAANSRPVVAAPIIIFGQHNVTSKS